jgi:hypothetical protein
VRGGRGADGFVAGAADLEEDQALVLELNLLVVEATSSSLDCRPFDATAAPVRRAVDSVCFASVEPFMPLPSRGRRVPVSAASFAASATLNYTTLVPML